MDRPPKRTLAEIIRDRKELSMQSELNRIQCELLPWEEKNFPNSNEQDKFEGIVEEVGELAHARLKMRQGIRKQENHQEAERDAIGDMVIFLLGYCNYRNLNLEKILVETWDQVSKRDWKDNPENAHEVFIETYREL